MALMAGREAELGGVRTRLLELRTREAQGSPLLLLHGFSDSADTWRPLLARLRELRRPALAVDLPGFGRASRLDRGAPILPQLDRFASAAIELAARRSPTGAVTVVGNSLGGCVALRAAERPELPIDAVVPIAPAGLDMPRWFAAIEASWAVQAILRSPLPIPDASVRRLVGEAYRRLVGPGERAPTAEQVATFASHVGTRRDVIRILGTGRRLLPELAEPFRLERIARPTLVIWGERDRMVYPSGARRILEAVPGARLELIDDCGHCPQLACPDRVAALIAGLQDELAQAAPRASAG